MVGTAVEDVVRERYRQGAEERVADLCCPVDYDPRYLAAIPQEVLERDYGCGDPSRHLQEGETVLDLGSGTGKICFIAAQVVGPTGRVIGLDMTDEMLAVARRNAPVVAERLGFANVEFRRGRIQDMALDVDLLDQALAREPVTSARGAAARRRPGRRAAPHPAADRRRVGGRGGLQLRAQSGGRPGEGAPVPGDPPRAAQRRPGGDLGHRQRRGGAARAAAGPRAVERLHLGGVHRERLPGGVRGGRLLRHPHRRAAGGALAHRRRHRVPLALRRGVQGQGRGLPGAPPGGGLQGAVPRGAGRRRPPHAPRRALRGLRQDLPALPAGALPRELRIHRAARGGAARRRRNPSTARAPPCAIRGRPRDRTTT